MTVYVVQDQQKKDPRTGQINRRFDTLDQLENWGEVRFILPPFTSAFDADLVFRSLEDGMADYMADDWLVLVGTTTLCGAAFARAAWIGDGSVRLLQWSSRQLEYVETRVRAF